MIGKKTKQKQTAKRVSKIVLAVLGVAAALGYIPQPVVDVLGPQVATGTGVGVALLMSLFLGKDLNLKQIANQIGVDMDEIEDTMKKKKLKKMLRNK